tara:strand:- start:793 stop:1008 length:216 start_codon:yes stop_codon:yes gene_type:complete
MLTHFADLEDFYGKNSAALFHEELIKHYEEKEIKIALYNGDLCCKYVLLGPDLGKKLYSLSPQGRLKISRQ